MGLLYITPNTYSSEVVEKATGSEWVCTFCRASSTRSEWGDEVDWVCTPLKQEEPRFICLACCIELHAVCASEEFEQHPAKLTVEEVAQREGVLLSAFRK